MDSLSAGIVNHLASKSNFASSLQIVVVSLLSAAWLKRARHRFHTLNTSTASFLRGIIDRYHGDALWLSWQGEVGQTISNNSSGIGRLNISFFTFFSSFKTFSPYFLVAGSKAVTADLLTFFLHSFRNEFSQGSGRFFLIYRFLFYKGSSWWLFFYLMTLDSVTVLKCSGIIEAEFVDENSYPQKHEAILWDINLEICWGPKGYAFLCDASASNISFLTQEANIILHITF